MSKHKQAVNGIDIDTGESDGGGVIRIGGALSFATVPLALRRTRDLFERYRSISVDLGAVQRTDSAALALLLEWRRLAAERNITLHLDNAPTMLRSMARVSDLEQLLQS